MIVAEAVQHKFSGLGSKRSEARERGRGEGHHRTDHVLNLSTRLARSARGHVPDRRMNAVFLRLNFTLALVR